MLSSKSATAPALNLKPSRIFAAYTILGHALGLGIMFYPLAIPESARLMVIIALITSFIYHWRTKEPVKAFRAPLKDDRWLLRLRDGSEVYAVLKGEYTVTSWLIVIRFKIVEGKKVTVVVLPDSAEADEIRRMRVYLKQL